MTAEPTDEELPGYAEARAELEAQGVDVDALGKRGKMLADALLRANRAEALVRELAATLLGFREDMIGPEPCEGECPICERWVHADAALAKVPNAL